MKITTLQKKYKFTFYVALCIASLMLTLLYCKLYSVYELKKKCKIAIQIINTTENITARLNGMNVLVQLADKNKTHQTKVAVLKSRLILNDSIGFLTEINKTSKSDDITSFLSTAKSLTDYWNINTQNLQTITVDSIQNKLQTASVRTYIHNLYDKRDAIVSKQIAVLNYVNKQNDKNSFSLILIIIALTISFSVIVILGYTILLKFFKNRDVIFETLSYNTTLLGNISDAVITVDKNLLITNWNKYAEDIYGYKEAEVKGKLFYEVMQLPQKDVKAFHKIASEVGVWKGEMIHYTKDNNPIHVKVSTSAIYDKHKKFIGGIGIVHNISHRVKMQNELQLLTQKQQKEINIKSKDLNLFFERIADAFFILDNSWNYVYINNASLKLHGKTKEELIGKNIWELYPELVGGDFFVALETAKQTQVRTKAQFYYKESNKWFNDLIYPDADGISVYYTDITAGKIAELQLNYTLDKLSFHLTNTPLAVLEFDNATNIMQWSKKAEDMFGWSAEDIALQGIKMHQLLHVDDQPAFYEKLNTIVNSDLQSETIYNRGIRKDGSIIYCEWYNSFLKNDNTNGVMLALVKDITKNKQTEINLVNAEVKFRSLVEDSLVGVYIRKGKTLQYVNPRFAQIFEYSVNELLNNFNVYTLINEADGVVIDKLREDNPNQSIHYEFEGIKKNGQNIYIEVFGNTTILNGDEVFIGTIIDITERRIATEQVKNSQIALKKSNESYEIIATATKDAIWDWDIKSNVLIGNERLYELYELEKNTVLVFDDFIQKVHKDDRGRILANSNLTIEKKGTNITEEFRLKQNNGGYKIVNDRVIILYDEHAQPYRMLGAMQDITETKIANKKIKQSQLALKKSNERYEYIAKATKDAIWDWDIEHDLLTGNDTFLSYFNLPSNSKFKFIEFYNKIHEADKKRLHLNFLKALKNKQAELSEEFKFEISPGNYRTLEEKAYILYNHNDKAYRALVALRDITEIKEAEQKLLKAKELSESTINSLPGIFFIAQKGGKIKLWNKNFEVLSGASAAEVPLLNPQNIIGYTDKHLVAEKIASVYKNGSDYIETTFVSNNGTQTPFYFTGTAIMYENELCLLCIGIDNSAKAKSEKQLKESEEKYKLLFNENPMPMWIITDEGKIINANNIATAIYGYSKQQFLNMLCTDLHPPDNTLYKAWLDRTDEHKDKEMIWQHQKSDGTIILVQVNSSNIIYNGIPAQLTLATDITDQVKAKQSLEQTSRAFRELASKIEEARETERTIMARDIHDELGQQLTGLKMDISWINKKVKSEDKAIQTKMAETIQLIDKTVITVRRISTALRPSILDDLGLIAAMEWQSEEFEKRFEIPTLFVSNINHIVVSSEVATGLFRIFQECLTNINRHAQATQIECNFTLIDNMITLTISDNGKGFKEEDIKHKKTLGLLGMKERVLLINGTYQIKGNEGRGVTVLISVPLNI